MSQFKLTQIKVSFKGNGDPENPPIKTHWHNKASRELVSCFRSYHMSPCTVHRGERYHMSPCTVHRGERYHMSPCTVHRGELRNGTMVDKGVKPYPVTQRHLFWAIQERTI